VKEGGPEDGVTSQPKLLQSVAVITPEMHV